MLEISSNGVNEHQLSLKCLCYSQGMDDEANANLVELIELLQEIDEQPHANNIDEQGRMFVYDKDGNKVLL